jgi:hypothetical protein
MKRQIRRGVFETNSSSMHSITVKRSDDYYTPDEILQNIYLCKDSDTGEENCVWEPWDHDMEFGRSPFRALGSFTDKWLYACASLVGEYNGETYKELVALALKYIPGLKKIKMPTVSDSIPNKDNEENKDDEYFKKYGKTEDELIEWLTQKGEDWDMKIGYWESSNGYWHYDKPFTGYVDENILSGFLKDEGISLEEYLTNKKYVVIQDGDEYCEYDNFKQSGLINEEIIDHEYPKREW